MNLSDWERAQELFLEAAELPVADRDAFLRLNCGGDEAMRREVKALLAADEASGDPLQQIVAAAAFDIQTDEAAKAVGRRIGPYVIEREIGSGGMGTVYLAFRDDDQFHQRVAIKVVNRGMDSEFAVTRFRRERQVLADLQHPNIARLLDGGATADGMPFFAMEYLEGAPLTGYCNRKKLGKRARLDLFLQVCAAVQYAHRNLVIHGDLKPGNILVGEDGMPKLLDFGIATLIEGHSQAAEFVPPLTAGYASPEQLEGKALTTATDVYSLGAILRELLAGQASGDPDHIVKLAMCTNADERYASVDELARDIRRYMEFRPVLAHQGSLWRRTIKLARRRWFPLLAASAVLASLVGGTVMARAQARDAEAARRVAEDRLTQMVSLSNRSLSDVSLLMERLPGALPARKALIGATLEFLEKLSKDSGADSRLRLALAKAYSRLGALQGGPESANMGDIEGAIKSYRAGTAVMEGLPFVSPDGDERLLVWLELQRKTGMLMGAQVSGPAAVAILNHAIEVTSKLPERQLAGKDLARSKAGLYLALARAAHADLPQSLVYGGEYLKLLAALVTRYPDDADLQYDFSVAHNEVGYLVWNAGDFDPEAAVAHYLEGIRIRERLVKEHPGDGMYRRSLMLAYEHFGSLQGGALVVSLGKPAVARLYYRKAMAIGEAMMAADPQESLGAADYATLLVRYAALESPADGAAESLAVVRRATAMLERQAAAAGNKLLYNNIVATAHEITGRRLVAMGNYTEAVAEYRRAAFFASTTLAAKPDDREGLQQSFDAERGITRALTLAGDRAGAMEHAGALLSRAEESTTERSLREKWIGQAYLLLATVRRAFEEWMPARDAAREAIRHAGPILTGRPWDPNAGMMRDAQALVAECSAKLQAK